MSIADVNAGILAAFGILAAYINRLRTGEGSRVETSLLQASMQQLYWYAAAYFSTGAIAKPVGTAHPLIAPYQVYQCADGGIALGAPIRPTGSASPMCWAIRSGRPIRVSTARRKDSRAVPNSNC
jgi:crotonobetainyl-CoA:carnitine CoA-transferase CaiB-like acyl-CoA transferase